jgi:hypothetical protein
MKDNVHEACDYIAAMRKHVGKDPDPQYYFCNQDEPYADTVLGVILAGEDAKSEDGENEREMFPDPVAMLADLRARLSASESECERLRDAECPKCGRSLPPDGDCYGCEVDRLNARNAELESECERLRGKNARLEKENAYYHCGIDHRHEEKARTLTAQLERVRELVDGEILDCQGTGGVPCVDCEPHRGDCYLLRLQDAILDEKGGGDD